MGSLESRAALTDSLHGNVELSCNFSSGSDVLDLWCAEQQLISLRPETVHRFRLAAQTVSTVL